MTDSNAVPSRPRRWTETLDGIRWLPRMIDKARMTANGTIGSYLMGHSPVDRSLLYRLKMDTKSFVQLVSESPTDDEVLAKLRARGFDEASVRRWSDRFPITFATMIPLWDLDEGYVPDTPTNRLLRATMRAFESPMMAMYRMFRPAP